MSAFVWMLPVSRFSVARALDLNLPFLLLEDDVVVVKNFLFNHKTFKFQITGIVVLEQLLPTTEHCLLRASALRGALCTYGYVISAKVFLAEIELRPVAKN